MRCHECGQEYPEKKYVLMAYYGEWDVSIKLLGVFSSMKYAEEAKAEYENIVKKYLAKNPFPECTDYEQRIAKFEESEENEAIYDAWRYGENMHLVDYSGASIYEFVVNELVK